MNGFFITATDTGVGKTSVSCAIARYLVERDRDIRVCKPVETGVDILPVGESDAERLQWAARSGQEISAISPLRLDEPLAPLVSAKRNGVTVCYKTLTRQVKEQIEGHFSLVEGAGGLLVPLCEGQTIRDLATDLGLPLLVVIRPDLGTLNHSLLTFEAARSTGLEIAGYVINRMPENPGPAETTVAETLAAFTDVPCLGVFPAVEGIFEAQTETLMYHLQDSPNTEPLRNLLETAS